MTQYQQQPNFNDYFQTALLAANARLSYENLRAIQGAAEAEASYRELQFWKGVVRDRYPEITGTMDTEDAAMRLMGFDRMETAAQNRRDAGLHESQRVRFRSRIWGLLGILTVTLAGVFVFVLQGGSEVTWEGDAEDACAARLFDDPTIPSGQFDEAVDRCVAQADVPDSEWGASWDAAQPQGWIFVLVMIGVAAWYVAPVFVPQPPQYHPQDDSIICQTVYPGRTLRLKDGRTFRVSRTKTPHYYPRRLRFDVWAEDGRWFSSDEIIWDAAEDVIIR